MIQYEFKVSGVDCIILEDTMANVITTVHYRYIGTNKDGIAAETYGAMSLPAPLVESFTPFNSVTSVTVINWLNLILGTKNEDEDFSRLELMQQSIENEINLKVTPVIITLQLNS